MLIIGYHVAKTGGTTLMHHIINHLGDNAFFGYGNHPAKDRFFSGLPLWEELPPEKIEPVKFLFGHHVHDKLLWGLNDNDVALFSVLRDPFTHFVSQYKWHLTTIKGQGRFISAKDYFKNWKPNRVSGEFFKFFKNLLPNEDVEFNQENVFQILRQFRFLCATEYLTEQSNEITNMLGIPPVEGRFRVSENVVDLQGLTAEDIYERSPIDLRVHQEIMARAASKRSEIDYDDAAFQASRKRINGRFEQAELRRGAYEKLAQFFRVNGLIEAAQVYLSLMDRYERRYLPILHAHPKLDHMRQRKMVALAEFEKGKIYFSQKYNKLAAASFEKAITLNEDYADAYVVYAHCLKAQGEHMKAKEMARFVLEKLDSDNEGARRFLEGL